MKSLKPNTLIKLVLWGLSVFLLIWMFVIPPFQNADESAHYIKTCASVVVETHPVRGGYGHSYNLNIRELAELSQTAGVKAGTEPYSWEKFFSKPVEKWDHWRFYPHAVPNTIIPYALPHVTCQSLAATSTPYQYIFYAIRIAFVASFVALIYLARKTNGSLFMACAPMLMLPMVINQGAAISADSFSIASAFLFGMTVASMMRDNTFSPWKLAVSLFLLWNAKIVYLPITAILLIPLIKWKEYRSLKFLSPAIAFGAAATALQFYYLTSKSQFEGDAKLHSMQLARLLAQPTDFLKMVWSTLANDWPTLLQGAIGNAGWLTTPISTNAMWVATATLLAWIVYGVLRSRGAGKWHLVLLAAGALAAMASLLAIYLSMYLFWTHPDSSSIRGVQGRYFIPLLFFMVPLIFSGNPTPVAQNKILLACALLAGTTVSFLLLDVVPAFYR